MPPLLARFLVFSNPRPRGKMSREKHHLVTWGGFDAQNKDQIPLP